MIKKLAILSSLCLSVTSFASNACMQNYANELDRVELAIENSNAEDVRMQGIAIAGGLALSTTATATGGSATVSTTVGAKLMAAVYAGNLYIDLMIDDDYDALVEAKQKLYYATELLKEARTFDGGPLLETSAQYVLTDSKYKDISYSDLKNRIAKLDIDGTLCANNKYLSMYGIIDKALGSIVDDQELADIEVDEL
jgi:hypothetical protein